MKIGGIITRENKNAKKVQKKKRGQKAFESWLKSWGGEENVKEIHFATCW